MEYEIEDRAAEPDTNPSLDGDMAEERGKHGPWPTVLHPERKAMNIPEESDRS